MKKLLLALALTAGMTLSAGNAHAISVRLDLTSLGLGSGDGVTRLFDQLQMFSQTTSTDLDGIPGGAFTDVGHLAITSMLPSPAGDTEGLDSAWFLTGAWNDLSGYTTVTATGFDYTYTSGTMKLYAGSTPYSFGSSVGSGDDTGFTSGTEIATLSLVSGTGELDTSTNTGATKLFWKFTSMKSGVWKDQYGNDLNTKIPLVLAVSDANTNNVVFQGADILSDHDGSVAIAVTPEPTSLVLFGSGLVGFIARRKKKILA